MGRPLNKKYFGNTNYDAGIGGESIASIAIDTVGTYTALATVLLDHVPTIPGVAATLGSVHMKAKSATVSTSGTGTLGADYLVGDKLTIAGATAGTAAVFTVTALQCDIPTVSNAGTGYSIGDLLTVTTQVDGTHWTVAPTFRVATLTGAGPAPIATVTFVGAGTTPGTWVGIGAPTEPLATTGGGANNATFTFRSGVKTVSLDTIGDMTTLGANPIATTTNSVAGAGTTLTVSYGVLGVDVTDGGSGYENATDAAITFSGGGSAATGHSVMTAALLNAITPIAKVIGSSTNLAADIVKQTGSNHYSMTTSDGTSVCTLVATSTLNPGDAYLIATDSTTSTYYVTKLTAHRATLILQTDNGNAEYPDGWEAPWTLDAASVGTVSITNY